MRNSTPVTKWKVYTCVFLLCMCVRVCWGGGVRQEQKEAVTRWTSSLACQRHDDIDPGDFSPSVSLTEVTGLFIKMEIEPCCSHARRQTPGTQMNSSKNKCTCTPLCISKDVRLDNKARAYDSLILPPPRLATIRGNL